MSERGGKAGEKSGGGRQRTRLHKIVLFFREIAEEVVHVKVMIISEGEKGGEIAQKDPRVEEDKGREDLLVEFLFPV